MSELFQYFSTVHLDSGRPVFLKAHIHRLRQHADLDCDWTWIEQTVIELAKPFQSSALRIALSEQGNAYFHIRPIPIYPCPYRLEACRIVIADPTRHTQKVWPHPARRHPVRPQGHEEVWLDGSGHVLECEWSNIWMEREGRIYTPPLSAGILQGVMRTAICVVAERNNIPVCEEAILWSEQTSWALSSSLKYIHFTDAMERSPILCQLKSQLWENRHSEWLAAAVAERFTY